MATLNPYIHFNGNAEEAFTFYRSVFGGEFGTMLRYQDFASPEHPISETDALRLMHITLPIGNGSMLMGSDTIEAMGEVNENDNRNSIAIMAASREEADRLFNGLSDGGTIEMPMTVAPFGSYFGMFTDQFGVEWMVNAEMEEEAS